MKKLLLITSLLTSSFLFAADTKPTSVPVNDSDALVLRTLQLKVLLAQSDFDKLMQQPVVIEKMAAINAAQKALAQEQAKHPECTLSDDNKWTCQPPEKK